MSKPEKLQKTMTSKLLKRMETCDTVRSEAIQDLKTLRGEAISKHDQTARAAVTLGKQLEKNPENKKLQKEYAGAVSGRKMFHHAAELNTALIENEGQDGG